MKGGAGVDDSGIDISGAHQHIRRRMAIEHEAAVAVGCVGDKSQRCARRVGICDAVDVHIFRRQHSSQVMTKGVVADLPHESGGITQARHSRGDIGWRAAGRLDETGGFADCDAHLERHEID